MNREKLRSAKAATIAIGLATKNDQGERVPFYVAGSGFFVDEDGCFLTAGHVITGLVSFQEAMQKEGSSVDIVVFCAKSDSSGVSVTLSPIVKGWLLGIPNAENYFGPRTLDMYIGKTNMKGTSFLSMKKPESLELYDEIAMCGYPRGKESMDMQGIVFGPRFSPVIQFGRISGFLPTDEHPARIAIQTDIIGTGGSSGSPIIDPSDGLVIAMAQRVFTATIRSENQEEGLKDAIALVGCVYGVTSGTFYELPEYFKNANEGKTQVSLNVRHPTILNQRVIVETNEE